MTYIGIDPSYSKTGVCYFDIDSKTILLNSISPSGSNETYADAANRSSYIATEIIKHLDYSKEYSLLIEEPLVNSLKASRLGQLSGILTLSLSFIPNIKTMYTLNPNVVSSMNKHVSKYKGLDKKKVSYQVAVELLTTLNDNGYTVVVHNDKLNKDGSMKVRKMSHDEAEAFLIVLLLLRHTNAIDRDLLIKLTKQHQGLTKPYKINYLKGIE